MRTKKESRSLLPGVRRLLSMLANTHPLVVAVSPTRRTLMNEEYNPTLLSLRWQARGPPKGVGWSIRLRCAPFII